MKRWWSAWNIWFDYLLIFVFKYFFHYKKKAPFDIESFELMRQKGIF